MSRLDIMTPSHAQTVIDGLYRDVERRIAASPPGLCPVDLAKSFLDLCHAQTCGKCVPCRIGLGQLSALMEQVLEGEATMETISIIERVARVIVNSADCAIGRDAARLVLDGVQGFRDDYEEHILRHRCLGGMREPVPCVALCPAGVDIPGYLVLIKYGRYADAVRLIRKDNPFPSACAYICEHPCEARCRRNMIDDAVNIRGLKRYAVDNAGYVPQPDCAEPTGKKVAVIGGGPGGLYAAFTAAQRGHAVTLYEKGDILGGNMRLAAYPPGKGDITNMVRSYIAKCEEYGVKMVMNTEVPPAMVAEAKPDAVIVATGSNPLVLPIPGINDTGVIHAGDLLDGKASVGKKVLVVGGGMVGCEVADFLGELGHEVSVIELRDQLGPDVIPEHRKFLMKDFEAYKVQGVTGAKVAQFFTDGVSYTLADGTEGRLEGFDNVVLAMGYRNNDTISEEIKKIVAETYVIGDAVKARKALDATAEGLNAALEI